MIYPLTAINSAKAMATSFTSSFTSFRQLGTLNISSATLPNPQQLEQQMLSGNPNNISTIGTAYQSVFAPLPAQTAVPQNIESKLIWGMRKHRTRSRRPSSSTPLQRGRWKSRAAQPADRGLGSGNSADS